MNNELMWKFGAGLLLLNGVVTIIFSLNSEMFLFCKIILILLGILTIILTVFAIIKICKNDKMQ